VHACCISLPALEVKPGLGPTGMLFAATDLEFALLKTHGQISAEMRAFIERSEVEAFSAGVWPSLSWMLMSAPSAASLATSPSCTTAVIESACAAAAAAVAASAAVYMQEEALRLEGTHVAVLQTDVQAGGAVVGQRVDVSTRLRLGDAGVRAGAHGDDGCSWGTKTSINLSTPASKPPRHASCSAERPSLVRVFTSAPAARIASTHWRLSSSTYPETLINDAATLPDTLSHTICPLWRLE
jgi:hypothetical protein